NPLHRLRSHRTCFRRAPFHHPHFYRKRFRHERIHRVPAGETIFPFAPTAVGNSGTPFFERTVTDCEPFPMIRATKTLEFPNVTVSPVMLTESPTCKERLLA